MSGVLCFVSQDGPFADDSAENEVSFSLQQEENATFVYRNEQELDQIANRVDQSTLQNSQNMERVTTQGSNSISTGRGIQVPHMHQPLKPQLEIGPFWMCLGRLFNSTILSIILIGLTVTLSLALGGISVFVVKPYPYFDKSLDAFQVPNHKSTERLEAFNLAKEDSYKRIMKRSINDEDNNPQYSTNRDNAIPHDAIKNNEIKQKPDTNSINTNNMKLLNKYKNPHPAPPVNVIHENEQEVPKSQALSRQRRSVRKYRSTSWKLQLVYEAQGKDDLNIFTKERLETIHKVEMSIMNHEGFTRFCARNYYSFKDHALDQYNNCLPPNSLMTYFYPSKVGNEIKYDGVGSELADINGTLSWAMQQESFYWFVDMSMNSTNRKSSFIRSEVYFGRPIGDGSPLSSYEQFQEYKEFVKTYIKLLKKSSTSKVLVLFGGTEIFDYEVSATIQHDLMLAIPCIISITILLFILTSFSIWLTICGCFSILLSFAWAYFVFHVICGIAALGLLNLVSAFVVIGIGVDDVFVFVNTFRQADHIYDSKQRMAYTVKTAGTATFFTSVTTAGAFAANMASQIPAIYSFGLFMMLIVSFCWLTVFLIMPPALNLWQRWINCEVRCLPSDSSQDTAITASPSLQRILTAHEQQQQEQLQQVRGVNTVSGQEGNILDDDIPMLDIDEDPQGECQKLVTDIVGEIESSMDDVDEYTGLLCDDDDVPILSLDNNTVSTIVEGSKRKSVGGTTKVLQAFLKTFVAEPVTKYRWVVIAIYLLTCAISLTLVLQIEPSSRPPALYREDTNLQRLLDLAYNFSGKDINCKSCSGFMQTGQPEPPARHPVTLPTINLSPMMTSTRRPLTTTRHSNPVTTPWNRVTKAPVTTKVPVTVKDIVTTKSPVTEKSTCANANLHCKYGAVCEDVPHQGPKCQCDTGCPIEMDPYCDTQGQTYPNKCVIKVVSCQLQKKITIAHKGQCEDTGFNPPKVTPGGGGGGDGGGSPGAAPGPGSGAHAGGSSGDSPGVNYNPCKGGSCGHPAARPILDNTAVVYVVFGVSGVDSSNVTKEHVLNEDKGKVIYDDSFKLSIGSTSTDSINTIRALCKICKSLAMRTDLVMMGGAECFPASVEGIINQIARTIPECADLPKPNLMKGQRSKAIGKQYKGELVWLAMAFESITYMGKSSFEAYKDYNLWENALDSIKAQLTDEERVGVESAFQTCEYWKQVFMEIVGVTSAIYGLAFSLLVCVVAVVIFTAHVGILLIAFFTISGVILVVISMFYLLGWQMGAVEAVSLSILVGSSVDYCIHLIEGYLVAGDEIPNAETKSNGALRQWRTRQALTTIGVSILSSAITTFIAAIPLSCTTIQLFAKFGKIVAINTFVSIVFTLTACSSFLSVFAPARYKWNLKWLGISILVIGSLFGGFLLTLYAMHKAGFTIPGPSGDTLFQLVEP